VAGAVGAAADIGAAGVGGEREDGCEAVSGFLVD
jgi:hypothetical protein